jgi:cell wall assembly regulator SMI1
MPLTVPRLLSAELLDQLASRWRSSRWPGVDLLNPGLTDDEIDAATDPLGFRLPAEVRLWWRWHDGISVAADQPVRPAEFGAGGRWYLPLAAAIDEYKVMRDVAAKLAVEDSPPGVTRDDWWPKQLFPITKTSGGTVTACDCSVRQETASPIHIVDYEDGPAGPPQAPSFGTTILWWIMAIDTGAWFYDADEKRWNYDWEVVEAAQHIRNVI